MASIEEANLLFKNLVTYEKSVVMAKKYVKYHKAVVEDLKRLEKLEKAIDILKEFNIELTFENDTYFMDCCKSNDIELNGMDWGDRVLTKEEYLLLKEVLGE